LGELITRDCNLCFLQKFGIFSKLRHISPTSSYEHFWPAARELLIWPLDRRIAEDRGDEQVELTTDEVVGIYYNALERRGFSMAL
jgi:hypothetical protein